MLGCDYHCDFCQNWITSQALRDPLAVFPVEKVSPDEIMGFADRFGARIITSTYNEPLITSEWAVDIFKLAKKRGMLTSYVSNANATPEVLEYLSPWLDMYKVDLKCFNKENYRRVIGGNLQAVLDTIKRLVDMKFWVEVVTLMIPGFNDSEDEVSQMARFLARVSCDVPWHLTAFHQEYKMTSTPNTPIETLVRSCEIGKKSGLKFVYAGNLPTKTEGLENTCCPKCTETLVERRGFSILKNTVRDGKCPVCSSNIPGIWDFPYS
jgi:pyruvate formate lyase activating enzyme